MKKILATTIIILIASMAIFLVGWVQFWVPTGTYGILISKTGGVDPRPIEPGKFRWQWERLVPTNARILSFDLEPVETSATAEGALPSADLYSAMLEGKPDFTWNFSVSATVRLLPAALPALVKAQTVKDQDTLRKFIDEKAKRVCGDSARKTVGDSLSDPALFRELASDKTALARRFQETANGLSGGEIEIVSAEVQGERLPDFDLYALASATYASYQERKNDTMAAAAKAQANASVADFLEIERFQALGEVLTKYPILIDYLAVTREGSLEAFKTIRERK